MPPLPATGLLTWGPSRLRAVIRLLLAEHCLPVDSDLTGFPASHAIWDDHGPKAARSEPLFDLLPKGPTRAHPWRLQCHPGADPNATECSSSTGQGHVPAGPRSSSGRNGWFVPDGTYALTAPPRSSETHVHRWPHLGVNGQPLNSPPIPKTNTDGGKSANTKACKSTAFSHALTLLF